MKREYRSSLKTRKTIKDAFVELLIERNNNEPITVSDIVERADVAKSTFYNHYADVYAVADEFENEVIAKLSFLLADFEDDDVTKYEKRVNVIIDFLKSNEDLFRKTFLSSDTRFFVEKLKGLLSKNFFEDRDDIPFSTDEKKRAVQICFLTNACTDTLVDYFYGNLDLSLEDIGVNITEMLNDYKFFLLSKNIDNCSLFYV